jgi:hypothetical protein
MTKTNALWSPVSIGCLLTPVLYVFGIFISAGGYNYGLMILLFPYAMVLKLLFESFPWYLVLPVFFLQFPFYGLMIALADRKAIFRPIVITLAMAHVLMAALCGVIRLYLTS